MVVKEEPELSNKKKNRKKTFGIQDISKIDKDIWIFKYRNEE